MIDVSTDRARVEMLKPPSSGARLRYSFHAWWASCCESVARGPERQEPDVAEGGQSQLIVARVSTAAGPQPRAIPRDSYLSVCAVPPRMRAPAKQSRRGNGSVEAALSESALQADSVIRNYRITAVDVHVPDIWATGRSPLRVVTRACVGARLIAPMRDVPVAGRDESRPYERQRPEIA